MVDLYRFLPEEMEKLVIDMGYPRYRADQILLPLYYKFPKKMQNSLEKMKNYSLEQGKKLILKFIKKLLNNKAKIRVLGDTRFDQIKYRKKNISSR